MTAYQKIITLLAFAVIVYAFVTLPLRNLLP